MRACRSASRSVRPLAAYAVRTPAHMEATEAFPLFRIASAFFGPMPGQPRYPSVASPVSTCNHLDG